MTEQREFPFTGGRKPDWMDSWERGEKPKTLSRDNSFEELCC